MQQHGLEKSCKTSSKNVKTVSRTSAIFTEETDQKSFINPVKALCLRLSPAWFTVCRCIRSRSPFCFGLSLLLCTGFETLLIGLFLTWFLFRFSDFKLLLLFEWNIWLVVWYLILSGIPLFGLNFNKINLPISLIDPFVKKDYGSDEFNLRPLRKYSVLCVGVVFAFGFMRDILFFHKHLAYSL